MCCWVEPLTGLDFQSLNRLYSPDGPLSLCKSYAETWDPLNALLNMGKHKNKTKIPVGHKSFKSQQQEGNVPRLLVLSFSLVSVLYHYNNHLG